MNIRSRNKVKTESAMSSMTDLVFLLLIFFILLSTMITPTGEAVNLPKGGTTIGDKPKVSITVTKEGKYQVNEKTIGEVDPENPGIKREEIISQIEGELIELLGPAPQDPDAPKQKIVLHVDGEVETNSTVEIISMARENGWNIVLATDPKK